VVGAVDLARAPVAMMADEMGMVAPAMATVVGMVTAVVEAAAVAMGMIDAMATVVVATVTVAVIATVAATATAAGTATAVAMAMATETGMMAETRTGGGRAMEEAGIVMAVVETGEIEVATKEAVVAEEMVEDTGAAVTERRPRSLARVCV
jgi:hypothetical protein